MSAVIGGRIRMSNRQALVALSLVLAVVLVAYRDTARPWCRSGRGPIRSPTLSGPPIALWLIWRRREELADVEPRPVPGCCCRWQSLPRLVARRLASVNALTQFAMTGLLVLAVPAVLGWRVARVILFPLVFLFLAVPFGEFLLPQ
jgi:hypothetical protein